MHCPLSFSLSLVVVDVVVAVDFILRPFQEIPKRTRQPPSAPFFPLSPLQLLTKWLLLRIREC